MPCTAVCNIPRQCDAVLAKINIYVSTENFPEKIFLARFSVEVIAVIIDLHL